MEITSKRRVEEMALAELLYSWVVISVELIVRASMGLVRVVKGRCWKRGETDGRLEPGDLAEEVWFEAGEESTEELTEWMIREDGVVTRDQAQIRERLRRSEVNQRRKAATAEEIRQVCFERNCGREKGSRKEVNREASKAKENVEESGLGMSATVAKRLRRLLQENAKVYENDMYEAAFLNAEMEELPKLMELFLYNRRREEVGKMKVGVETGKGRSVEGLGKVETEEEEKNGREIPDVQKYVEDAVIKNGRGYHKDVIPRDFRGGCMLCLWDTSREYTLRGGRLAGK
jgi:hypothetical protein